ncbi:hypothetical protein C8R45DRAFT_1036974 [Mycena sanguinolenta]|nr:hypothetical protein C8R45DRAFT_1036974 [Mycena sanguinolenta]
MKRFREFLGRSKTRASSAPPSSRVPDPSAPALATLTRPASPQQTASAPLPRESTSSASQTAWTNLKEVLKAVRDGSELYPPFQAALTAVISGMESMDCVREGTNELGKITNNLRGFQGIFSQYDSQKDVSSAICRNLDAMAAELTLIEQAISPQPQRGSGHLTKDVMIIFRRLNSMVEKLQLDMGLHASNYNLNVSGGVGGVGGMSEHGIAGNGGIGQGPNLNINATNCIVNTLSTGWSTACPSPV